VTIGYHLFKNPVVAALINVFETILMFILNLPVPFYRSLVLGFITQLPGTPYFTGPYLRAVYYKGKLKLLGSNVVIEQGVKIVSPGDISIGDDSVIDTGVILAAGKPKSYNQKMIKAKNVTREGELSIGKGVLIQPYTSIGAMGGIIIEDNVGIGPRCTIFSYTHLSMKPHAVYEMQLTIGENVLIGSNSSIICVEEISANTLIKPNTFLCDSFLKKENKQP
jgi:acetyltransferase-like isoleucine patch superfamily enzyme